MVKIGLVFEVMEEYLMRKLSETMHQLKQLIIVLRELEQAPSSVVKGVCREFEKWLRYQVGLSERTAKTYALVLKKLLTKANLGRVEKKKEKTVMRYFFEFLQFYHSSTTESEGKGRGKQLKLNLFNLA